MQELIFECIDAGKEATSIVWGAWATGMAANAAATLQRFERQGMGAVTASQGLTALSHILSSISSEMVMTFRSFLMLCLILFDPIFLHLHNPMCELLKQD